MKRTIIALILTLGLLLMPSPVSAAGIMVVDKTGDGVWTEETWTVEIYPGETKVTVLELYNSSSSLLDVEVTILPESLDNGNLTFELDKSIFTMSSKANTDIVLTVRANGSVTPGTYATDLTIRSEVPYSPSTGGGGGFGLTTYLKVDLWGEDFKTRTDSDGEVRVNLEAVSDDGMVTLYIDKGVWAQTEDETRLKQIEVVPMEKLLPVPRNGYIIGAVYDFSPAGATFDPFIKLKIGYEYYDLPTGIVEKDLLIAYYDEEDDRWLELGGVVETIGNTVTTKVKHLTPFAVIGYKEMLTPASFTISKLVIFPTEVDIGQNVTVSAIVKNTGGKVGVYEVVLKVNDVIKDTERVMVSAGASKKVTFVTSDDTAGSWRIDVNGLRGSLIMKVASPLVDLSPTLPAPTPPLTYPPEKPIPWALIVGVIGGLLAVGGAGYWLGGYWFGRGTK